MACPLIIMWKNIIKVRYTDLQIYLLDYKRTMEQIVDVAAAGVSGNKLGVGITNGDINIYQ